MASWLVACVTGRRKRGKGRFSLALGTCFLPALPFGRALDCVAGRKKGVKSKWAREGDAWEGEGTAILPRPIFSRFTRSSFLFPSPSDAYHAGYMVSALVSGSLAYDNLETSLVCYWNFLSIGKVNINKKKYDTSRWEIFVSDWYCPGMR